jgi:hypothetical protein
MFVYLFIVMNTKIVPTAVPQARLSRRGKIADHRMQTSFTIDRKLLTALKREAASENRSVSGYVTMLIERHLREVGEI